MNVRVDIVGFVSIEWDASSGHLFGSFGLLLITRLCLFLYLLILRDAFGELLLNFW